MNNGHYPVSTEFDQSDFAVIKVEKGIQEHKTDVPGVGGEDRKKIIGNIIKIGIMDFGKIKDIVVCLKVIDELDRKSVV